MLEAVPKEGEDSQYSKTISWVHKVSFVPLKVEFYDLKGKLLKVMTAKRIQKIDDRWVVMVSEMANQQKGTKTVIKIGEIDFKTPIADDEFTKRNLERG